jgi:hypothetical protein
MLARWRKARFLGLLVFLLASGLSSGATAYLHSCPVSAGSRDAEHSHDGSSGGRHHAPGQECQCIGTCSLAWSSTTPEPVALDISREVILAAPSFAGDSAPIAARPDRLLPPATAPPSTL